MLPRLAHPAPGVHPSRAAPLQLVWPGRLDELGFETGVQKPEAPRRHLHQRDALPAIGGAGLAEFDGLVFAQRRVRSGHMAFLQGQPFKFLHAVRTGSFKTTIALEDGREQVSRFCFDGDLMGLDGLGGGVHASTATALEDSIVYLMVLTNLPDPAANGKPWHQVLYSRMGQEIVREHAQMLLLGSMAASARLATFLLEMSDRMRVRNYSPMEFHLRMSRADIGSYLGLRLETVSRMLSTLQQQGVLRVDKRHVVIRSIEQLRDLRDWNDA